MSINHYLAESIQPKLDIYAKEVFSNEYSVNNLEVDNLNIIDNLKFVKLQSEPSGNTVLDTTGGVSNNLTTTELTSTDTESVNFLSNYLIVTPEIKTDEGVLSSTYNRVYRVLTTGDIVYSPIQLLTGFDIRHDEWRLKFSNLNGILNIKGNAIFRSTVSAPITGQDLIFKIESGNYPLPLSATNKIISSRGYGQFIQPLINSFELDKGFAQSTVGAGEITLNYGVQIPDPTYWSSNTIIYFNFDIDILLS